MADRFFAPGFPAAGELEFDSAEAHHLSRVLRAQPGLRIELFDGAGRSASAEVVAASRKSIRVQILDVASDPPQQPHITLATAIPKGDRFRWLVEKATELGVNTLMPLLTARSVVEPGSGKLDKMQQATIEACKQCGRNRLMRIAPLTGLSEALASEHSQGLIAHPGGTPLADVLATMIRPETSEVRLFVGPEGGFLDEEAAQAQAAGVRSVSLGPNILRIETAAITLAACCRLLRTS